MLRIPHSPVDTLRQRLVEIRIVLRITHSPVDTLRQRLVEIRSELRILHSPVDTLRRRLVEIRIVLSNKLSVSFRINAGLGSGVDFLSPFGSRHIAAILCGLIHETPSGETDLVRHRFPCAQSRTKSPHTPHQ